MRNVKSRPQKIRAFHANFWREWAFDRYAPDIFDEVNDSLRTARAIINACGTIKYNRDSYQHGEEPEI